MYIQLLELKSWQATVGILNETAKCVTDSFIYKNYFEVQINCENQRISSYYYDDLLLLSISIKLEI